MNKKSFAILLILTPLVFLITHAIAYFFHEYLHSFSAWILGYKSNPLDLHYGDSSWGNLLLLGQVSENVNYSSFMKAHPWAAAFIAFAGSGIGNVLLLFISIFALQKKSRSWIYYYFFLWLAVMNLGNFIDYVPSRTLFASDGDVFGIITFLQISPWLIMIILGYPICFAIWYFYSILLTHCYAQMKLSIIQQAIILILITCTLFLLFGAVGIHHGKTDAAHLMGYLSLYAIPIVLLACWPQRKWVRERVAESCA